MGLTLLPFTYTSGRRTNLSASCFYEVSYDAYFGRQRVVNCVRHLSGWLLWASDSSTYRTVLSDRSRSLRFSARQAWGGLGPRSRGREATKKACALVGTNMREEIIAYNTILNEPQSRIRVIWCCNVNCATMNLCLVDMTAMMILCFSSCSDKLPSRKNLVGTMHILPNLVSQPWSHRNRI